MNDLVKSDEPAAMVPASEAGTLGAMVRARAEIESAITVAKKFPRDETAIYAKLMKAVERAGLAEDAVYSLPRGNESVEGPSVYLAREAARLWGNNRFGVRIVTEDEDRVHLCGYHYDAEHNSLCEVEDKFQKLVYRKSRGWIKPDELQLRELVNRRGAFAMRNAILQALPRDFIDDAVERAKETMKKAAAGDLKQSREDAVRRVVRAFDRFAVTTAMIAAKLKHDVALVSDEELADLRRVYKSMADGASKREDHFEVQGVRESATVDLSSVTVGTPSAPRSHGEAPPADVAKTAAPDPTPKPEPTPPPAKTEEKPAEGAPRCAELRAFFLAEVRKLGQSASQAVGEWAKLEDANADDAALNNAANARLDEIGRQAAEKAEEAKRAGKKKGLQP